MAKLKVRVSDDGLHREIHSDGLAPVITFDMRPMGRALPPKFGASDFALIAVLPIAMHEGAGLEADFAVDATLLDGLEHFQDVWHAWRPDIFRFKIPIVTAGEYKQSAPTERPASAVSAFSSGVDSTFTLARHIKGDAGRARRDIRTAVLVHGFDMPLAASDGFDVLARSALAITDELGVNLVTVKTNWRQMIANWEMTFGAGLVSVLHQFSDAHDMALIATEESYQNCFPVWGNSFWTDRFFSASGFNIESDGGAYDRIERAAYVGKHRALIPHLRVCWAGPRTGENCGVCPKCVLTKLNFVAAGVAEPWPFPQGLTPQTVYDMPIKTRWQSQFLELILSKLEANPAADALIVNAVRERLTRAGVATANPRGAFGKHFRQKWVGRLTRK
ncbi:MAG TPA: hypothetical protein PLD46_06730 [Hyphomicrobium sp.]|nr:hypothetical protein [Hyphomicrobium sp.]